MAIAMPQNATREEVFGSAVKAMSTHLDVHWWAIVGHGEGGTVASTLASVMHVRTHCFTILLLLILQDVHLVTVMSMNCLTIC